MHISGTSIPRFGTCQLSVLGVGCDRGSFHRMAEPPGSRARAVAAAPWTQSGVQGFWAWKIAEAKSISNISHLAHRPIHMTEAEGTHNAFVDLQVRSTVLS